MKLVRRITGRTLVIVLAILLAGLIGTGQARVTAAHASGRRGSAKATRRTADLIDINHATVGELESLPGIQDAYASKIVKNRPYANKTQLSSKGVIPAATYRKIKALIIAKQ